MGADQSGGGRRGKVLRPTTVEEEKFSKGDKEEKMGEKREREKDKETRGNKEKGEKRKRGKMPTFTTMEKEKSDQKKTEDVM